MYSSRLTFKWIVQRVNSPLSRKESSIADIVYALSDVGCVLCIPNYSFTDDGYQIADCLLCGMSKLALTKGMTIIRQFMEISQIKEDTNDTLCEENSISNLPTLALIDFAVSLNGLAEYNEAVTGKQKLFYMSWWVVNELTWLSILEIYELVKLSGSSLYFLEPPEQCHTNPELSCNIQFILEVPRYNDFQNVKSALSNYLNIEMWSWIPSKPALFKFIRLADAILLSNENLQRLSEIVNIFSELNKQRGFS
ncbi:MAG: hypothetical protein ABI947_29270 [Chloroflexota bacterium]